MKPFQYIKIISIICLTKRYTIFNYFNKKLNDNNATHKTMT